MINVLIIENPQVTPVTWWRFFKPFSALMKIQPGRINLKMTRRLDHADLFFTDVFIVSRPNDQETFDLIRRIKDLGRSKIILDIDDAITNLPYNHTLKAEYDSRATIARQIFANVDYVWTSTEQLIYECDAIGRGEIIPNAIDPKELPSSPAPDRGAWMWRGKDIQKEDVYTAGVEVYEQIKSKAKSWTFWGCLPSLQHLDNVRLQEYERDTQSYFEALRRFKFNGVWKPLADNQFNDAKSNIAWIEATMSGGVCLTNYAGKKSWEYAIDYFPTYEEAVRQWEQSKEAIERDYNIFHTAAQRLESIERLLGGSWNA